MKQTLNWVIGVHYVYLTTILLYAFLFLYFPLSLLFYFTTKYINNEKVNYMTIINTVSIYEETREETEIFNSNTYSAVTHNWQIWRIDFFAGSLPLTYTKSPNLTVPEEMLYCS